MNKKIITNHNQENKWIVDASIDIDKIEENQKKAEICSNEECDGVLKWSTRFRESQQENKQLKEELKSVVTLLDNTSAAGGKLKSKLEKIKDLLFVKTSCTNEYVLQELKKILEDKSQ